MSLCDIGTGTSIVFGTSAFTAELTAVDWSGISRGSVQCSHLGTTNFHKFIPTDLVDPGELNIEFNFDPSTTPPYDQPVETITVTFPVPDGLSTPADWEGDGFMTNFEFTVPLEEKMTGSATLKMTGAIVITAAA